MPTSCNLLLPTIAALSDVLAPHTLITADAGYHSEANLAALAEMKRIALIPDNGMRARDERFEKSAKYKHEPDALHDKDQANGASALYDEKLAHHGYAQRVSRAKALRIERHAELR